MGSSKQPRGLHPKLQNSLGALAGVKDLPAAICAALAKLLQILAKTHDGLLFFLFVAGCTILGSRNCQPVAVYVLLAGYVVAQFSFTARVRSTQPQIKTRHKHTPSKGRAG